MVNGQQLMISGFFFEKKNPDTGVDFNTLPVTNMAQFPQFCILKTVTSFISIRSKMQIHVHGFSVDNCLQDNEDDESDMVLEEDEVREVLASAWKQKRQEISKEKLRRCFGRPSTPVANPATRKFRAEVEELKLRTKCNRRGNVGHWHENVHRNACRATKEVDEVPTQRRKKSIFQRKLREKLISVTGTHSMNPVFCVSSRVSTALCWTGFANAENSVVHCWRKRRNRKLSVNVPLVSMKQMLNSSPGKGITDTGCAKMMMGSDTFKQYLDLLTSKERKVREKNRFKFGDNETRMSHWSAVIPMNIGKYSVSDLKAIPPTYGGSSGPGQRASDIQQVGRHDEPGRIINRSLCH